MKKLFLLDAMALIYRAYYALNKNPRINSKGLNTSAMLGFANTLYDVIKTEKPTHIGVAFDTMAPTARHVDFVAYKANREAMPEDLSISIPYIQALIKAFNIPLLYVDGYEADDVIGTLAKQAEQRGFETYMMTPDKDFGQLVSDKIFMYKPGKFNEKAEVLGVKEVCEKFGVSRPEQIIDLLGLWGDSADNIPGIAGVGAVTARKLLAEYDTLENVLQCAPQIKNEKLKEKILANTEMAIVSKQLATIILDVPIDFDEEALRLTEPDRNALKKILDELEFRTFAKRVFTDLSLAESAAKPAQPDLFSGFEDVSAPGHQSSFKTIHDTAHAYILADTAEQRNTLLGLLMQAGHFCFDTETTGLDPITSELVGVSFSLEPGKAFYMPIPANREEAERILAPFRPVFENPEIEKTGQNLKFDISILKFYNIEVKGKLFDTMLAHYLIQPDQPHNMDYLSQTYLGYQPVPIEQLIGKKGKDQGNMRAVEPEKISEYAGEDADITLQLRRVFEPKLRESNTTELFEKIEMPLVKVLSSIEAEGIRIDAGILGKYAAELKEEISVLEFEILEMAGMQFNIASPKQLGEVLFDHLKISDNARQTSKTKQYSTGEDVLLKLEHKHPIIKKILDYRSLSKLKSTYVDALPSLINPVTGRVHSSFNQAVAATGRLSSNNPNLQNIPVRTERGREIRKAFVPRSEEFVLMSADYSQIELRIIAAMSRDEGMIEAFRNGIDIHTATAAKVYGIPITEVTKDMRRHAKSVNFGIIYGISAFGLSEQLAISRKEAAELIAQYFKMYPGIKQFMEDSIAFARQHGYVETLMKRRRYLREINSSNAIGRGFAERNAINAPIQGSAADMIKIAMINIHRAFEEKEFKSRMILQVHDELVFDAHRDEIEVIRPLIRELMATAIPLEVPIEVDINTGLNWLEAH